MTLNDLLYTKDYYLFIKDCGLNIPSNMYLLMAR